MIHTDNFPHDKPMGYSDYLDYKKLNVEPASYEQLTLQEVNSALAMAVEDDEDFMPDIPFKRMSMKVAGGEKRRSIRKKSVDG